MKVPFCNYEVDRVVVDMGNGHFREDALAIALPCFCANGHFKDFADRLSRFNSKLKLGFDCIDGCYVIYRNVFRIERLNMGGGKQMKYAAQDPFVVKPLQWTVIRDSGQGGKRFFHFARDPGDWALRDMSEYAPQELEFDSSWIGPKADRLAREAEAKKNKALQTYSNDIVDDVMSSADRGNPLAFRTSVAVKSKKTA